MPVFVPLFKVYTKFEIEYEPDHRALLWAHGLIQHQLAGGLHQLVPVRTNNLLERIWRVFKYASIMVCDCVLMFAVAFSCSSWPFFSDHISGSGSFLNLCAKLRKVARRSRQRACCVVRVFDTLHYVNHKHTHAVAQRPRNIRARWTFLDFWCLLSAKK